LSFFGTKTKAIVIITAGIIFLSSVAVLRVERYFSSTKFCLSCHSMSYAYEDLKRSVHYGSLGIDPGCGDCHFPPEFYGKVKVHIIEGIRDTISELRFDLSTREAFEKRRSRFAEKARDKIRSWDSAPCKVCHKAPRPGSEEGREAHEEMNSNEFTCVDCHQGIFHEAAYASEDAS
jgi:nitrate/TMAO reductase-like tetraheme cytochrome c subunit